MRKIAVAQIKSSPVKQENLRTALDLVKDAKSQGAELIAFPEFLMAFSPPGQSAEELTELSESVDGPFVNSLREAARAAAMSMVATIYETCPLANRVYDTAVWIDAGGQLVSVYRKLHLYDAFGFKESDKFHPGEDIAPPVKSGEISFGMMICYDVRFPELARLLTLAGANVIVAPSGWIQGDLKLEHWQTMIKARALENGCYLIGPGQVGNMYIGHSMVVDPLGRTIIDLGDKEGFEVVNLDMKLVTETREKLPLLKNRRTDVYFRHPLTKSL
jgi:deaminated glutathione amidase